MSSKTHQFHLVDLSPWPILSSLSLLPVTSGAVMLFHKHSLGHYIFALGVSALLYCVYSWWRDVIREGKSSHHTPQVQIGLKIGMCLFILSEVMFFITFFWSFFKARLFPVGILDGVWPGEANNWPGVTVLDPWDLPFLNTLILLLSGTTVTWAHYAITNGNKKDSVTALGLSILLGLIFTSMQAYEYHHALFALNDGIYGSNFYMATGFHGIHVIIGTIFLSVCYFRAKRGDFLQGKNHLGFEFAAWYWHFVDVVWLFLFIFVYVLGR